MSDKDTSTFTVLLVVTILAMAFTSWITGLARQACAVDETPIYCAIIHHE